MKSFSVTSFPSAQPEILEQAQIAVQKDPLALFTDFQWYLFRSQNVVYFTAFSTDEFDRERLRDTVVQMVSLAPQLTHGYDGAHPGQPFDRDLVDAITSIEEVDEFEGYPDKWLETGERIFAASDLPLFRVKIATRRGGADNQGRKSMIMILSSHALMEGSDSALLTRGQHSGHGTMSDSGNKVPLSHRLKFGLIGALTATIHLISAYIFSPEKTEMGFKSVVFDRHRLRKISNSIGVRQRSLMFALVMYALNDGGKGFSPKQIKGIYSMLDSERHELDDDFFRVRVLEIDFPVILNLEEFARDVDKRISDAEKKDITTRQFVLMANFKAHRFLSKLFPFLYGPRFFRYSGGDGIVLTMVPPHHTYGELTRGIIEPIYCGSYHPATNLCTYVPARHNVTFNFSARAKHLPNVDKIEGLIAQLEDEIEN